MYLGDKKLSFASKRAISKQRKCGEDSKRDFI
jgi:hypothetical protein